VLYGLLFVGTFGLEPGSEEAQSWDARLSLRNVVTFADAMVYRLVALFCVILAGSITANEFGWRTILPFATWTGDRRKLLGAKLIVTGCVALGLIVAAWLAVGVSVVAITVTDGRFEAGEVTPGLAGELCAGVTVTWLAAMVYAVIAAAIAVWTRSAA